MPDRLTVWGLPPALSARLSEALRAEAAEGVNVTLMVQLPFTVTTLPQLFVCAKSEALAPVNEMLVMVSTELPALVSVTGWAALVVP